VPSSIVLKDLARGWGCPQHAFIERLLMAADVTV